MKKSITIFGSEPELHAFKAIDDHLPEEWRLYGNTPLSQIVKIERSELSEKEWDYYLKSSVDFVLTDAKHEPCLAIEFDGIGKGYSWGKTYVLGREVSKDPFRELKMNFKIKNCYAVGLPLIVISFDEIGALRDDEILSSINSIVGLHIAHHEYKDTIEEWDRERRGDGKTHDELLWELCTLEAEVCHKNDPLLRDVAANWQKFDSLGASWGMETLTKPDLHTALTRKRFESFGCRFVVKGGTLKTPVVVTAWVKNFAGDEMLGLLSSSFFPSHGINPLKVAENIAWFLGVRRAIELS